MLFATFRLYTGAYFWLDDFTNLYWIQTRTLGESLWLIVSPSATHFRPVGMFVYWAALQLFDRDAFAYHLVMWALHSLNVFLVYMVLKRLTASRAGAAVGAMFYVYPAVFSDLFWSFGTIFELAGAALFFTGLLVWHREKRTLSTVVTAAGIFFLSMKTKEMAITLPAVWVLQDLLLRRPLKSKDMSYILLPGIVGLWFGLQKVLEMRAPDPTAPYFMDLRALVMGMGYGYYFNLLFETSIRWETWAVALVAGLVLSLKLQWRHATFFLAYVFITFLPVIFLVNHRDEFYWYFPMLGVSGLAAVAVRGVAALVTSRVPERRLAPYAAVLFAMMCAGVYISSRERTEPQREWQHGIARDYRAFVEGLRGLPEPQQGDVFYFTSMPRHFGTEVLRSAAQVALRRPDIDARLVEEFPAGARYRLAFENSRIVSAP